MSRPQIRLYKHPILDMHGLILSMSTHYWQDQPVYSLQAMRRTPPRSTTITSDSFDHGTYKSQPRQFKTQVSIHTIVGAQTPSFYTQHPLTRKISYPSLHATLCLCQATDNDSVQRCKLKVKIKSLPSSYIYVLHMFRLLTVTNTMFYTVRRSAFDTK